MGFSEDAKIQEMVSDMEVYYSKEEQGKYGVVGIGIEVIFASSDIYKIISKEDFEKDIAFDFYFLHDEIRHAFQAYVYNRKEFGKELAHVAVSLLGVANATGYDLFDEIQKEFRSIKRDNEAECEESEEIDFSSSSVRDYFIDGPK